MSINFNGNISVIGSGLLIGQEGTPPTPPYNPPPPNITNAVIANSPMKVGDTVGVTITVDNDQGDVYTNLSGNVGGFPLTSLARVNNTTYTAQFVVTEGGIDVEALEDVPLLISLDTSVGSTSQPYDAPIIQNNDQIDATSPIITKVSIPDVRMDVGDVVVVTISVVNDEGDVYTNLIGTVGGFSLSNLTRINSITYTAQFTVVAGGVDIAANESIPTSLTIEDTAGNVSDEFNTPIVQPNDPLYKNDPPPPAPVITNVFIPNIPMIVGDVVTAMIMVADDDGDIYKNLVGNINGFALANLLRTNNTTYTGQFTITEGGSDINALSNIPLSLTLDNSEDVTSVIYNTPIVQNSDPIDANSPIITNITIPNSPMILNDVVTATITVGNDGGDVYTNLSASVGGYPLTNLTRVNSTTYTAQFTVTSGGNSYSAPQSIPTLATIEDSLGNSSVVYNTAITQNNDSITPFKPAPVITNISIPNTAMTIGDTVNVTITVVDDDGDIYKNLSGNINGYSLTGLSRVNSTTYSAQFLVAEGGTDISAAAAIPLSVTIDNSEDLTSAVFNTSIVQNADPIDANRPVITNVSIPNTPMYINDIVIATITVSNDGGDIYTNLSGNIGGYTLLNLTRVNSTTYTAQFTVTSGGNSYTAIQDIPLSLTLEDSLGNSSLPYTISISQNNDSLSPTLPPPVITNVSIPNVAMVVDDVVVVTITVADDGGDTYTNLTGNIGGYSLTNLTRVNNTTYTSEFTITLGGNEYAAVDDIPVLLTLDNSDGLTSTIYNTPISQLNDPIDASFPKYSEDQIISNGNFDSVAMSGDGSTIAVGRSASNEVDIYIDNAGTWQLEDTLTTSNPSPGFFGISVDLSNNGNTLVVGGPNSQASGIPDGAIFTFTRSGSVWSEGQTLTQTTGSPALLDSFGTSVAINSAGTRIFGGAWGYDSPVTQAGAVRVFELIGSWSETALIQADIPVSSNFGRNIDISESGNTLVVGAATHTGGEGRAYIFQFSGSWTQEQELSAPVPVSSRFYGETVLVSGDGSVVAVSERENGSGRVYTYNKPLTTWSLQDDFTGFDATPSADFGIAMGMSSNGELLVAGARGQSNPFSNNGAVYDFYGSSASFTDNGKVIPSNIGINYQFGSAIAVSSDASIMASTNNGDLYIFTKPIITPPSAPGPLDDSWWSSTSYGMSWDGTKWNSDELDLYAELDVIQSGINDNWEVGFRPASLDITILLNDIGEDWNDNVLDITVADQFYGQIGNVYEDFAAIDGPASFGTEYIINIPLTFASEDFTRITFQLNAPLMSLEVRNIQFNPVNP